MWDLILAVAAVVAAATLIILNFVKKAGKLGCGCGCPSCNDRPPRPQPLADLRRRPGHKD